MKYSIFLFAVLFSCISAFAQHSGSRETSVARERLVAYGFHYPPSNPVPTDTVTYYYSGENGSDTVDINFYFSPYVTTPNHQTIKCDSYIYKVAGYVRGIYTYNSSGDATAFTYEDTIGTGTLALKRYTSWNYALGLISADSQWSATTNYVRYHVYDGSGYLIIDSIVDPATLVPTSKAEYSNNTAGFVLSNTNYGWSSGTWVPASRRLYTYDGSNRVTSMLVQTYSSSVWNNYRKDSFNYSVAGTKYYTYYGMAMWTSGTWVPSSIQHYHLNASNQWDTVFGYYWNTGTLSIDTGSKQYLLYDTYGNLKSYSDIQFNPTTHAYLDTPFEKSIYYYETYTSTLDASAITRPAATVKIYPNPVSGALHIGLRGLAYGNKASLAITDVLGRNVMNSQIGDGENIINVSALHAGIYIVSVSGDGIKYAERLVKVE